MMRRNALLVTLTLILLAAASFAAEPPGNLRCEWRVNPSDVRDPCPELYWEASEQTAFRILVDTSGEPSPGSATLVWDSGKVRSRLPIVRYAGPPLENDV